MLFVGYLAAWLLGVPLSLAWFGGLALFTLWVVAPGAFALSRVWIVLVPVAGVASAVLFLAALQYIVGHKCWRGLWPFRKAMLALFSMLLLASFLFSGPLWFVSDGWALRTPTPAQIRRRTRPHPSRDTWLTAMEWMSSPPTVSSVLLCSCSPTHWCGRMFGGRSSPCDWLESASTARFFADAVSVFSYWPQAGSVIYLMRSWRTRRFTRTWKSFLRISRHKSLATSSQDRAARFRAIHSQDTAGS